MSTFKHLGVSSIRNKSRETRLRWFGNVQHRPTTASVSKSLYVQVMTHQRKGEAKEDIDGNNKVRSKEETYPRVWPMMDWNGEIKFM